MEWALPDMVLCHRFDKNLLLMRTGRYGTLQMMSANPKAGLDRKLTEVVMLASKMEIEDIELQVGFRLLLYHFLSCSMPNAARCIVQGTSWNNYPLAFCAILHFIAEMRETRRRPVLHIGLSSTILTDSMVRRLVATLLELPPKPTYHKVREILEIQQVVRNSYAFCCSSSKR